MVLSYCVVNTNGRELLLRCLDAIERTHPEGVERGGQVGEPGDQDGHDVRVELEADTLEQVRRFLELSGVDVILLDNMNLQDMAAAVRLGKGRVRFEASGNVTLETVRAIATTGVDYISVGALTHSARAIDFSFELLP